MRNWGPWLAFLLLVPMLLYVCLGGVKYSIDTQQEKVNTCKEKGGYLDPRNNVCLKRVEMP